MVQEYTVEGYDNFKEKVAELSSREVNGKKPRIFVLFSGTHMEDGNSWCPDCAKAEPVIKEALKKLGDDDIVLHVEVEKLPLSEFQKHPFHTDRSILLVSIPTLMLWGSEMRVEGDDCLYSSVLELLFEEREQTEEVKATEIGKEEKAEEESSAKEKEAIKESNTNKSEEEAKATEDRKDTKI